MDSQLQVGDLVEDISEAGKRGEVLEVRKVFDSGDHDYSPEYVIKWNDGSQAGYGRWCLKKVVHER